MRAWPRWSSCRAWTGSIIWAKRPMDSTLLSNTKRSRKQPLAV
nr:MAG TPA: hypothetical protein [Caudoviricetes sp.]